MTAGPLFLRREVQSYVLAGIFTDETAAVMGGWLG
jgi:hypothetical protein